MVKVALRRNIHTAPKRSPSLNGYSFFFETGIHLWTGIPVHLCVNVNEPQTKYIVLFQIIDHNTIPMSAEVTWPATNSHLEPAANLSLQYTLNPDLNFTSEPGLNSSESVPDFVLNSTISRRRTEGTQCLLKRDVFLYVAPILFLFGNVGNGISFVVLRSGELKKLPMCFYLAVLALSNSGMNYLF